MVNEMSRSGLYDAPIFLLSLWSHTMSSSTRAFIWTATAVFVVTFNLGYVFHDLALGDYFHAQQPFAREHYIIPYIGLAFAAYALIVAHLFPIYRAYYADRSIWSVGLRFGLLMGVLFDALQGGIIEVATFPIPLEVFLVDSSYHVFIEGSITGLLAAAVTSRFEAREGESVTGVGGIAG